MQIRIWPTGAVVSGFWLLAPGCWLMAAGYVAAEGFHGVGVEVSHFFYEVQLENNGGRGR